MCRRQAHVLLRKRATPVALVCRPGVVSRLFSFVGANRQVQVHDTLDQAVLSLTLSLGRRRSA